MKVYAETESVKRYVGDEKAIEYIKKAGFDAFEKLCDMQSAAKKLADMFEAL